MQIGHGHGRINFMHDSSAGIRESLLIVNAFITQNCAGGYPDCFFWIGVPSGCQAFLTHNFQADRLLG